MKRYWYKFRVKYSKALDTGKQKKVSEEYLVDAESFTETEKRATKAATDLIGTRDFDITAISREPITEILNEDEAEDNHWYKTVVSLVSEDAETGVKKFSPQTIYVNASNTTEADRLLREHVRYPDRLGGEVHHRNKGTWSIGLQRITKTAEL